MGEKLNNAAQLESLQSDYFVRMMLPDAEAKAQPYVAEERRSLSRLIGSIGDIARRNFVVIGSGTIWYIELAYLKTRKYIAVEPLAEIFLPQQIRFVLGQHKNVRIIDKEFGGFPKRDLENANSLFVFHFNILSYIPDPIRKINKYLKKGDVLYISSWNRTEEARRSRKEYFDFINSGVKSDTAKIDPEMTMGLCNLDLFPFHKLRYYKSHKRIKGKITDVLIIYT